MEEHDALRLALAIYRRPLLKTTHLWKLLPDGVLTVIKIAAGDEESCKFASEDLLETQQLLREAAIFYLQQVLAKPGLDAHGCLCLAPGAAAKDIRLHKRWLLKWLHPDRNSNRWETVLFQRVLSAAEKLEQVREPVAVNGLVGSSILVNHVPSAGNRRRRVRSRPAPIFSWHALIKRALRPIVVLGAIALLFAGATSQFSNQSTGSRYFTVLLGW